MSSPKKIAVTGAAGQIGYSLLPRIAAGDIFGPDQKVILQCLEIAPAMSALNGVAMELADCSFPLLAGIVVSDDPKRAFDGADLCLLVGSKPRGKGMERKDLVAENGPIFTGQGKAIQASASPDVRVVVIGNPCNTNCLIAMHAAPEIPRDRFTAMTQLDHNRARALLAEKANVDSWDVRNPIIWGNHSTTQYPDWHHATISGEPAAGVIGDDAWLQGPFIERVQKRGATIIEARGLSSAMSAANAALEHSRQLMNGTAAEYWTSMALLSDGSYDVPEGLISSFPVTCDGSGTPQIVQALEMNDFGRAKVQASVDELREEKAAVADLLPAGA